MQILRPSVLLATICAGLTFFVPQPVHAQHPAIIPQPVSTQWLDGNFNITSQTVLVADTSDGPELGEAGRAAEVHLYREGQRADHPCRQVR